MPEIQAKRGKLARTLMVGLVGVEVVYASVALREWLLVQRLLHGEAPERRFGSDAMLGEGGFLYSSPSIYAWYHLGAACVALLIATGSIVFLVRKKSGGGLWLIVALVVQVFAETLVGLIGR